MKSCLLTIIEGKYTSIVMESCLLTKTDALWTTVFVCCMITLNNILETDSVLNIALFTRLTGYKKKSVSTKIYYIAPYFWIV